MSLGSQGGIVQNRLIWDVDENIMISSQSLNEPKPTVFEQFYVEIVNCIN